MIPNEEATTPALTKKDWIDVARESRNRTVESEYIERHLGAKIGETVVVSNHWSVYERTVQQAAFEDYLTEQGYVIDQKVLIDDERVRSFEYTEIEIDEGVYIKIPDRGYFFLTNKDGLKLVIHFDEFGYHRYKMWIYVGHSLQALAKEFIKGLADYSKVHNVLRGRRLSPSLNYVKTSPAHTWDSVILPATVRAELKRNIDLIFDNIDIYKKNGMTFKRGIILKGEPGVGKTMIGKILCNVLKGITFIWVTPGDLTEVGRIKTTCELARSLAPSVLFLEDIDLYGGHRERENRGILGELMNQLDGVIENEFVVVIATTNRAEELEAALRNRPGRFDRVIDVPKPDEDCRKKMLDLFLGNIKIKVTDKGKLIDALVKKTEDFTGAHVKELVNSAIISAIDQKCYDADGIVELKVEHFQENFERVKAKKMEPGVGFKAKPTNDDLEDFLEDEY